MQLDYGIGCQLVSSSTKKLWGTLASIASPHPSFCVLLLLSQQEERQESRGAPRRLPRFLTLVRKPSLLLRGEWHLLITIETLWEVPPATLGQRFAPSLRANKQSMD